MINLKSIILVFLVALSLYSCTQKTTNNKVIHAVNSLSHYYDFHADWGFPKQYLNYGQHKYEKSWCCIYNSDLSNANLLFLFNCDDRLPYVEKDFQAMDKFLKQGGSIMILSDGNSEEQSRLANRYGGGFINGINLPVNSREPWQINELELKRYGHCHLTFTSPERWNVVAEDARGKAVLAYTKAGKGFVLLGSRALLADNPDKASDTINRALWHEVWYKMAESKKVDPNKPFQTEYIEKIENNIKRDGLDVYFNDYLEPYAYAMFDISKRCMPEIEKIMGVPLSPGMASKTILIPTGGGGYSSGEIIALAVWWGDFPDRDDSMIEFISHEATHSWVLPFAEIWNEPIATYVGNLVMKNMGYKEEARKRIESYISRAAAVDPNFDLYDLNGKSWKQGIEPLPKDKVNDLHWGKTYWIFEQIHKDYPDFLALYFQAKRQLALPGKITEYDENNTVAVMSIALNKDMFPWFRSIGFDVNRELAEIKF